MNVIVDTCVWSLALRRSQTRLSPAVAELQRLIEEDRVALIGPIRQELLSGIQDGKQFERLRARLDCFPDLPLGADDYVEAARFYNTCRRQGVQGSNTDFLICAAASRRDCAIFTSDRDFSLFAQHLPIVLHQARQNG